MNASGRLSLRCACCAPRVHADISRRGFLSTGAAALGVGIATATGGRALAERSDPRRIDVHHHLAPPRWIADVVVGRNTGQRPLADWTPARSIEDMDKGGVATLDHLDQRAERVVRRRRGRAKARPRLQ